MNKLNMIRLIAASFLFFVLFITTSMAQTEQEIATIKTYEGFPPMPFEAPDLDGVKHFLPDYKEKVLVLQFFDVNCEACIIQINALNKLQEKYPKEEVVILGLANDKSDLVKTFATATGIKFSIIPDVLELNKMAYAGEELKNPKTFIIDKYGVIKKIFLSFESEVLAIEGLDNEIAKYLKE